MNTPSYNFNENLTSNAINYQSINPKVGSQEKILNLQKGYKIWYRICIIFGISALVFVISMIFTVALEMTAFIVGIVLAGIGILYSFVFVTCCNGFVTVNPNEAVVFEYYGRYLGTIKENGYFYGYPLAKKHKVSQISIMEID